MTIKEHFSNYLGNLQFLDGTQNKEKNDSDFDVWLAENYKDASKLKGL